VYIHGVLISEATGLGTWAGPSFFSGFTNIGTFRTNWFGVGNQNMSDVFALNREATQVEMVTAATVSIRPLKLAHIGDSITIAASPNTGWAFQYPPSYNSGYWIYTNSAVGGQSIAANMATQVATIANADRIIMALGTNDNNAGDMAALQATVETGIDNLRTANPLATIYYLNVLPAWTNNTSGPEVAKGNIRTAIAAACAAKGVTCWDPYTTPWILQSDTQDGLHPTLAGHAKIAAQVLARLA
jgi:lysophospholipase L1-like esterase